MSGLKIKTLAAVKKEETERKLKALITPRETDPTEFNESCEQFRTLCHTIGQVISDESFKGGFDEIPKLFAFISKLDLTSTEDLIIYAQTTQLVFSWIALNESCKYLGSKLGYGQPEWWYQCWSMETNEPQQDGKEIVEE